MPTTETIKTITFEYPMNDSLRICLRLEDLLTQIKLHAHQNDAESGRQAISAITEVLDVISRPDLKSKLTQTLTQYASSLGQLEQFNQADPEKLRDLLKKLDDLIRAFHSRHDRIGDSLKNNDFLNQIRLRQHNPGGAFNYSSPAYNLWLKKSPESRRKDIERWTFEFAELEPITELVLFLTRQSHTKQTAKAFNGFYQQNLDPNLPCDLIRVTVTLDHPVFPEFSVGRHRLSLRFLEACYQESGRPQQTNKDIEFELACCRV